MSETAPVELDPNNLPSHQNFYSKFDTADKSECSSIGVTPEQLKSQLESKFSGCEQIINGAEKIAKAYCSACKMKQEWKSKSKPDDDENTSCEFFNFWLGDQYGDKLNGKTLSNLLSAIHTTLTGGNSSNKCRTYYRGSNETLVSHMKIIFDYFYDHEEVNNRLMKNGLKCEGNWMGYLEGIASACITMREACPNKEEKDSNSYCKDFHTKYGVHCDLAEALNLYCTEAATLDGDKKYSSVKQKLKAERQQAQTATQAEAEKQAAQEQSAQAKSKLEEAVHQANKASSLSSTFGTIAALELPALAYFLFKYKPWSSWFGNHSSGNGRSRKRRAIGRNFSSSTEDTLTEYSTETSTIGQTENSAVRSSVATYPRHSTQGQSTRRRNNNAGGRGMVGYQNM
ncbi:KIR-like protein [Plasmodium coatneyi]|uniref:KIR-like protein n=1 Tax=Plasmodium coatneyi TaxID=208452 RepID=A0A1B1DWA6_9APIC|nr:KIR-like protein [Plasmodium coatneyi]ANQ07040.1 KIR-like protein [Plasmodium coatneyi]